MQWGKETIDRVAIESAAIDYAGFERIGLESIDRARVLDIGCFDGFNTVLKFAPYGNIEHVVGIDIEDEALDEARNRTADERFSWEHASAESYSAQSDSFDVVYLSHTFQHVKDKERVAQNIFRLLKPGGFVVIKTFDDSCKVSYPDPDKVMRRVFEFYETEILPYTEHTRYTDRNNGQKCPRYLRQAGFEDIKVDIKTTDTLNKSLAEREKLFDRFTYFRKKIPSQVSEARASEYRSLLETWREMFKQEDYLHISNTFLVTARKPSAKRAQDAEHDETAARCRKGARGGFCVEPMEERDLGQVMKIEVEAFSDPWAPIAYAMELRHNPAAHYVVAKDADNTIAGYAGWWETEHGVATIMHIAVDKDARKHGIGSLMLEYACDHAAQGNCAVMQLQVRAQNNTARLFYKRNGFTDAGINERYYTLPDDDAVVMQKTL